MAKVLRFGLVGLVTTAFTYGVFRFGLAAGIHYLIAATLAWLAGMAVSYLLNRRFTFLVRRTPNLPEAGRFLSGGVLQYLVATLGYWVMIGELHLNPTFAFVLNVAAGCVLNFSYMQYVVFTSRSGASGSRSAPLQPQLNRSWP